MSKRQNELGQQKYFANRGVNRTKIPLPNIRYRIEILKDLYNKDRIKSIEEYDKYKFKDFGYLALHWTNMYTKQNEQTNWFMHGFITPTQLKEKITEKQWSKFCQDVQLYSEKNLEQVHYITIQRRLNHTNIKKITNQ